MKNLNKKVLNLLLKQQLNLTEPIKKEPSN